MQQPPSATRVPDSVAFRNDDTDPQLHADLSRPAQAALAQMPWEASPEPGVERKRLELIGHGAPRLTTLVRFAPGSRFARHGHDGGEEFIVLAGTFSDHTGDFHAGSYVRNPVGFSHAPFTEAGCTILVKLRQHRPDDRERVTLDTHTAAWPAPDAAGHAWIDLHRHGPERVRLCQLAPGADTLRLSDPGGVEVLLLDGQARIAGEHAAAPFWMRMPPGATLTVSSADGCRLYVKQGHLGDPSTA
jgi:hypothetical protein